MTKWTIANTRLETRIVKLGSEKNIFVSPLISGIEVPPNPAKSLKKTESVTTKVTKTVAALEWLELEEEPGITSKGPFKMRENPVISDWVHFSGGSTEGLLGR